MKERNPSYYPKAVYYRANFVENGKSKSKWIKIPGLEFKTGTGLRSEQIIITDELKFSDDTVAWELQEKKTYRNTREFTVSERRE
tara:strand:- start:521 stop:775 length:255 start_codon:yes stop_codon:yes gene_type:complete